MIDKFIGSIFPSRLAELCKSEKGTLLYGILFIVAGYLISQVITLAAQTALLGLDVAVLAFNIIGIVIGIVFAIILALLFHFLLYIMATKAFHGNGTFEQQFYMYSMPSAVFDVISTVIMLPILAFPNLVCGLAIVGIVLLLYQLYLLYIVMKEVHSMESQNAALSVVLAIIVSMVIYFMIVIALVVLFAGALIGTGALTQGLTNNMLPIVP